jgi:hypothetical protein
MSRKKSKRKPGRDNSPAARHARRQADAIRDKFKGFAVVHAVGKDLVIKPFARPPAAIDEDVTSLAVAAAAEVLP